jgi:hypothetical protein
MCSGSLPYANANFNWNLLTARAFGVFGTWIEGFYDGRDATARAEVAYDFGPDGVSSFDYVIENLIDDVFLEDAEVAIDEEILFERLQLHTLLARHVTDGQAAEVGQAGFGTDAGELGVVDEDLVSLELVLPSFDGGELDVEAGFCVVVGVAGGFGGHTYILAGLDECEDRRSEWSKGFHQRCMATRNESCY